MLTIHLFSSIQVFDGDTLLPPFPTQRSRELFAILASQPNHPHLRASLAGNLWPEKTDDKARASLNTELWRVRQSLGKADQYLELTRDTLALKIPAEQVDIHQFRALVKRGDVSALQEALASYRGEFLEGCYADWCLLEREQLADLFRSVLDGLLRHHESRGEFNEAIAIAKRLAALDPLREEMHRALMRLYAALGDRPVALAQYQTCKTILMRELGIAPMPETEALYLKIRQTAPLEDHWSNRRAAVQKISEHRLAEMRLAKQYLPDLYTPRAALDKNMEAFSASDAVGLILIGQSGCGKSAYLARLAETRLERGDLVLLLDSSSLTLNLHRELTRQLWGSETISPEEALSALGREAAGRGRAVWILLDELNAFHDLGAAPADLLRRLDSLIAAVHHQTDTHAVKFVIACREHAWRALSLSGAANLNWGCYFQREPIAVGPYTPEETSASFEAFRQFFKIKNSYDELSDEMRERCRTPFLLRLTAETWQGQAIPVTGSTGRLFHNYFERVVSHPSARALVADLVARIVQKRQAQLSLTELRADPAFQAALADDPHAPLQRLLEAGVLALAGADFAPRLRFAHERLLEYLLAQYYDAQCAEGSLDEDCIINMARDSRAFPALWGAALTLLLLGKNMEQFILLAESESSEARQLVIEGLASLHQEDASLAQQFASRLLARPAAESKRAALFAASHMGQTGFDLFRFASDSRDAFTRQTMIVVINAIYQRDPRIVLAVLHHLLDDISLRTFITASPRLQVGMRIMGFFTRYGLDKKSLDEAERLIHTLAVKKLRLPSESNRIGRLLVQRLLSINTTSWPADRGAVEAVAHVGSLTPEVDAAYRRMLHCLKLRGDGLDQISLDDLRLLLACPSDAVRYLAHHQLCMWINLREAQALQAIQTLFDSVNDPEVRLWLLMTFQPLNAPRIKPLSLNGLHTLENLTARFAEEHPDMFLEGVSRGTLGLFGPIAFFPLGMRCARAHQFDFPLLAARLASDPERIAQHLRLLAPVGWFHPQEALAFIEKHVNFKKALHPQLAETLGRIWVSHPEVVDTFLRRVGVDGATQQHLHADADIEVTLRSINLIHNTDLRVSSVLLGAPYGKWVTDSVFEGYVDSKSFEQAASRFGRGLVDVYMESGWRLKKILGLEGKA
ncbi:MAG: hypothetical protein HFACDABA_01757 [Anaerolineales bacterium]|nr:hypothetical protein [Anaerolineales bacterium]